MTTVEKIRGTALQEQFIQDEGGIPNLVKVLLFMVSIIFVFTGIANLLPQVEGQAPVDVKVDLGALTMDSYIAMGETLFQGKGTCTLCHNNLGRAPDILALEMETTALERLKSPDYKGEATDSESYFLESMVDPSKYVVPGYGKLGEPSPMPTADKAPIELSDVELGAIIAFLQAKDGGQPTVALPTDAPPVEAVPVVAELPKAAANAEEVLVKYACTACHAVLESPSTIGPNLNTVGARSSKEEIRQSILYPSAVIAEGYPPIMPGDFADKMMLKELEMVVDFLSSKKEVSTEEEASSNKTTETEQKGEK
jgi:mono/diheme cytochrome c family protein